jgi:hypothetical protein
MTTTTITVGPDGKTHTGDNPLEMEVALQVIVTEIMSDIEWTAEVVLAAVLAQHELLRGLDTAQVKTTLREGLSFRSIDDSVFQGIA